MNIMGTKFAFLIRGTYRAPHMKGHTCSITLYTNLAGESRALSAARTEYPWMVPASARRLPDLPF